MRLHTLSLEALGPFPNRVDVDFDELDQGILLVNGPTGSGKSSLLDAVTFALFGEVAGSRRAVRGALRSHHAAPDVAPWVELQFSVGSARWKVRRAPAWDAPKRRGTGTTTRPASVLLSQWRDGAWHLVSSRIDEAADMITDTLGMGLEQFAQVVLLPQGEFAQFLRAKPEDRRTLLERLFDVARFDAVERWFAETKNDRLRASDSSLERIRGHMTVVTDTLARLDDEDVPAIEWSDEAVATLPERLRDLLAAVRARRDDVDVQAAADARRAKSAERALERSAALDALRAAYVRAQGDLDAWPHDTVARMKRDADAADHVAGVLKLAGRRDRALAQLERARTARLEEASRLQGLAGLETIEEDVDLGEVLPHEQIAKEAETLHELQVTLPRYTRALDDLRAALTADASASQQLEAERESVVKARESANAAIVALDEARETLNDLPDVRGRVDAAQAASRLLTQAPGHLDAIRRATAVRTQALRDFAEREQQVVSLRAARLSGIAAELATDLVDGAPCPVCGSLAHPTPASPSVDAPDPARIEVAEHAAQEAAGVLRRAEGSVAAAQQAWESHLTHLQERLDASAPADAAAGGTQLPDAGSLVDDNTALRDLENLLLEQRRQYEVATAAVEHAMAQRDRAVHAAAAIEQKVAAASGRRDSVAERLTVCESALREARATLEAIGDAVSSTTGSTCTRVTQSLAQWRSEKGAESTLDDELAHVRMLSQSVEKARAHLREIERARAGYVRCHDAFVTALGISATAEAELADELVAKGYDDLDAANTVALDDDDLTSLRATWQHAIEVRAAAAATLSDEAVVAAAHTPATDASRLRRRADILARRASDTAAEAARWSQAYSVLASMRDRIADAVREHLPLAEAAKEMTDLASTFAGNGENTHRMRLTSYVLAAHLETVTTMANERLHRMTDGRYQLRYTDDRVKGNQRSGLGLLVVDAWTGRSRETATLSGGEAFMASLALALGLGDAVRADSGGMELHTLFVDEGFGSLDQDTLEQVMEVLDGLREGGRLVGVVSHVTELRARIPSQIEMRKTSEGSSVHTSVASPVSVSGHV